MKPFICLWLGSEYLLSDAIMVVIFANIFLGQYRAGMGQFLFGYGLVSDVWAPIIESVLFITAALIGGYNWGLIGILMATTISTFVIIVLWKPYFLFRKGFNLSYWYYWKNNIFYLVLTTISFVISKYIISIIQVAENISTWYKWSLSGVLITMIFGTIDLILLEMFTSGGKRLVQRFILKKQI